MIPTPDTSHLTRSDFEHVYEPAGMSESEQIAQRIFETTIAEDTFLLLDALEQDAQALRDLKPRICLEIGCVRSSVFR